MPEVAPIPLRAGGPAQRHRELVTRVESNARARRGQGQRDRGDAPIAASDAAVRTGAGPFRRSWVWSCAPIVCSTRRSSHIAAVEIGLHRAEREVGVHDGRAAFERDGHG